MDVSQDRYGKPIGFDAAAAEAVSADKASIYLSLASISLKRRRPTKGRAKALPPLFEIPASQRSGDG